MSGQNAYPRFKLEKDNLIQFYTMGRYVAHYKTLDSSNERLNGLFEFESSSKLNSKQNSSDARLEMLKRFGNQALSWQIVSIEKKKKTSEISGQMALDFRGSPKKKRKQRRKYM